MKQEEVRKLVERYPYLLPRNIWTGEVPDDYDYTYITCLEIPKGWYRLFLQMCEDIRQPLIDAGYFDKFRFRQIKEKYNRLECYNFGAPKEVQDIIDKYSVMAGYVCVQCGRPATCETQGYIASFCDDCWKDYVRHEHVEWIKFKPWFEVTGFSNGERHKKKVYFEREWDRYLGSLGINE